MYQQCLYFATEMLVLLCLELSVYVYKKNSEQNLRDWFTSCVLGRRLILQFVCHSTGCIAQWYLLHAVILQFLHNFF